MVAVNVGIPLSEQRDQFVRDENGLAVIPPKLRDRNLVFSATTWSQLKPDEQELIRQYAHEVYAIWKDNNFEPYQIYENDLLVQDMEMRCRAENVPAQFFDEADFELADDMSPHEFEVYVSEVRVYNAAAKNVCFRCPLQIRCLAQSITPKVSYRRDGDSQVLGFYAQAQNGVVQESGIHGGWGEGARKMIFEKVIELWAEDEEESRPEEHDYQGLSTALREFGRKYQTRISRMK